MIKGVIFDFGGVLGDSDISSPYVFSERVANFLSTELRQTTSMLDQLIPEFQRGNIDEKSFWGELSSRLETPLPPRLYG